jgi:hypothetical protein
MIPLDFLLKSKTAHCQKHTTSFAQIPIRDIRLFTPLACRGIQMAPFAIWGELDFCKWKQIVVRCPTVKRNKTDENLWRGKGEKYIKGSNKAV